MSRLAFLEGAGRSGRSGLQRRGDPLAPAPLRERGHRRRDAAEALRDRVDLSRAPAGAVIVGPGTP